MPPPKNIKKHLKQGFLTAERGVEPTLDTTFSRGLCRAVAAITMANGRENAEPVAVALKCFCQETDKPCDGEIIVSLEEDTGVIEWYCERCDAQGEIDSWQDGFFDCSDYAHTSTH